MGDDSIEITTKLTRGTGTDDRDTIKASVEADSVEELDRKLDEVKDRLEGWADDLRAIQPEQGRALAEDQSNLGDVEA